MMPIAFIAIVTLLVAAVNVACAVEPKAPPPADGRSPLDFTLTAIDGQPYPLEQHRGQVVLLVNTASKCGFTRQYAGLQALYERFADRGLVVIGVPSNDFLRQEPGSNEAIAAFCQKNYGVTFPMMAKLQVKGRDADPLYRWLTTASSFPGAISWNFNKFLIGRDGAVVARFGSRVKPEADDVVAAIEAALAVASATPTATSAEGVRRASDQSGG